MAYRRSGRSGLCLPAVSLGLWQNFGADRPHEASRAILLRAFDLGVTHFDLANNYGPPPGAAEETLGRVIARDLGAHRDELVISTKAGYPMWPGPYGQWGSRKHLLASLDASLRRLDVDHVDIFYSHRFDPDTPLEETMGALATAVASGKATYAGISSYSARRTRMAAALLAEAGVPLLVHQASYSLLNRWVEAELLATLDELGAGCIAFSVLGQGLLTERYLRGVPDGSRAGTPGSTLTAAMLSTENLDRVRGLDGLAARRGQSLAQMAIAWVLRDHRVTSALVGASRPEQLEANLAAVDSPAFAQDELAAIDAFAATDGGINRWAESSRW